MSTVPRYASPGLSVPAAMIGPVTLQLPTTDPSGSVLPVLPAAALDRLPAGPAGADPVWRLVAAFLVGYPPATGRAYLGDLSGKPVFKKLPLFRIGG